MLHLRQESSVAWLRVVLENFDLFLQDHALNEHSVAMIARKLRAHHPDKDELVAAMIEIEREELEHFDQVCAILKERGQRLGVEQADSYTARLHRLVRKEDHNDYLLDRLVLFAIIEARGCERFTMIFEALEPGPMKQFYRDLAASESRHHVTYLKLARLYFDDAVVTARLNALLDQEASIIRALAVRPAMH